MTATRARSFGDLSHLLIPGLVVLGVGPICAVRFGFYNEFGMANARMVLGSSIVDTLSTGLIALLVIAIVAGPGLTLALVEDHWRNNDRLVHMVGSGFALALHIATTFAMLWTLFLGSESPSVGDAFLAFATIGLSMVIVWFVWPSAQSEDAPAQQAQDQASRARLLASAGVFVALVLSGAALGEC